MPHASVVGHGFHTQNHGIAYFVSRFTSESSLGTGVGVGRILVLRNEPDMSYQHLGGIKIQKNGKLNFSCKCQRSNFVILYQNIFEFVSNGFHTQNIHNVYGISCFVSRFMNESLFDTKVGMSLSCAMRQICHLTGIETYR